MREQSSNKCSISNLLSDFKEVGTLYLRKNVILFPQYLTCILALAD